MLQINILASGVGSLTLILSLILIPLVVSLAGWYIADKNCHARVNRFFLKRWLFVNSVFIHWCRSQPLTSDRYVSCTLGHSASENGRDGISLIDFKGDGSTVREIVGKEWVRRTDNKNYMHYFYFAFNDDRLANFRNKPIIILIEYLDQDQGEAGSHRDDGKRGLTLKYDSAGNDFDSRWKVAGGVAFTDINGSWKWAGFNIEDGNFQRRQNDVGDFRIGCRYANPKKDYDLYLRRVMAIILQS